MYCVLYYTISKATYSCTIINVNNVLLSTVRYLCGCRAFPELLLYKDGVISDLKKGGKKHFHVYLFWALVEINVDLQYNNSWSLLRYLFCHLSWLSSTHSQGISGYCIQSTDFAHICHLQAVLRCWESSSHRHRGVPAHGNIIWQTAKKNNSFLYKFYSL